MFRERMPNLTDGAIAIVGQYFQEQRNAAGTVPLIDDLVVVHRGVSVRATAYRPFDVVGRHVRRLGIGDHGAKPWMHIRVAATRTGGDREFFDDAREQLAALGVSGALLVLDRMPLGMARHGETPSEERMKNNTF